MLGSAAVPPASSTPTSSTRSGRLRGLSYLRNYTRDHLPGSTRSDALSQIEPTISPSSGAAYTRSQRVVSPSQDQEESLQRREAERIADSIRDAETMRRESEARVPTQQANTPAESGIGEAETLTQSSTGAMRNRTISGRSAHSTSAPPPYRALQSQSSQGEDVVDEHTDAGAASKTDASMPTIRFIPHAEARSSRPSLHFSAVSRTLKQPHSVVRVGRYSERDMQSASPNSSVSPIGFKSKVVSRRHCEFWCTNGQWYVKDVKSSSGTFLNHVRLSSPGVESRPYPVNDGDVVQLGIDFKGGEEVIFRCVKIRIECNRGWQKSLNNFNTSAHKRLLMNHKGRDSDAASTSSSECSICLNPVAPCQALFVAPCSHVWHYKCIRNLVQGPNWPNFLCPNCRFMADLEADVEPPEDLDLSSFEDVDENAGAEAQNADEGMEIDVQDIEGDDALYRQAQEEESVERTGRGHSHERTQRIPDDELTEMLTTTTLSSRSPGDAALGSSQPRSRPVNISTSSNTTDTTNSAGVLTPRSATPTSNAQFALAAGVVDMSHALREGPATPRNTTGPFVFDGQDLETED